MNNTIIVNFDSQYAPAIKSIRNNVFTIEQRIDASEDIDGCDEGAIHALVKLDGEYVGTGRMLMDGHIGRLAVLKPSRGKGFGKRIVLALIEEARKRRIKRVYLGAQKQAVGFYKKLDFCEYGEPYLEVGIEHIYMEKYIQSTL